MIPLVRATDAKRINEILNHPEVRGTIADTGLGRLDVSRQLAKPNNHLLLGEHGTLMFFGFMPGIYELHTAVLPIGRGMWTQQLADAGFHHMYTKTDAWELTTRVPQGHVAAKAAAKQAGFKYEFNRVDGGRFRDRIVPVDVFSFRIQDWIFRAPGLVEIGEELHRRIGKAEKLKHKTDENHNRYVGAAIAMALAGQVQKGVNFYNRWAALARFAKISVIENNPPIVKMDAGLIRFENGDYGVF